LAIDAAMPLRASLRAIAEPIAPAPMMEMFMMLPFDLVEESSC
jgi:hypothetical protein